MTKYRNYGTSAVLYTYGVQTSLRAPVQQRQRGLNAEVVEGYLNKLRVPTGKRDVQVFDDALPGFGVRKFESGRASYFVKFNIGHQQRRLTLGAVVPGNLAEMRRKASTVLSKARLGQDAVAEKRNAAGRRNAALGSLIATYLTDREPKLRPRYFVEIKRQLERDLKALHPHSVEIIGRQAVIGVIDEIAVRQASHRRSRSCRAKWILQLGNRARLLRSEPDFNISPQGANLSPGARPDRSRTR